jgi:hypothetical protein
MNIKRGGIYPAVLDPVVGKEIAKTRPVLVVSNEKSKSNDLWRGLVQAGAMEGTEIHLR